MSNPKEFNNFFHKIRQNLPKNLTNEQMQEIALYAMHKLYEEKKKKLGGGTKEPIKFNPVDSSDPLANQKSPLSDSARSLKLYPMKNKGQK